MMTTIHLIFIVRENSPQGLLTEFLKHYKPFCKNVSFCFVGKNYSEFEEVKTKIVQAGFSVYECIHFIGSYNLQYEALAVDMMRKNIKAQEWVCVADLDEFYDIASIDESVFEKYNIIKGVLVDMLPENYSPSGNIDNGISQFNRKSILSNEMNTSFPLKVGLFKNFSNLSTTNGHHDVFFNYYSSVYNYYDDESATFSFIPQKVVAIYHYKWHAGVVDYIKKNIQLYEHKNDVSLIYCNQLRDCLQSILTGDFAKKAKKAELKGKTHELYHNGYFLLHCNFF